MRTIEVNNKIYKQLKSIQIYRELIHKKRVPISIVLKEMICETEDILW